MLQIVSIICMTVYTVSLLYTQLQPLCIAIQLCMLRPDIKPVAINLIDSIKPVSNRHYVAKFVNYVAIQLASQVYLNQAGQFQNGLAYSIKTGGRRRLPAKLNRTVTQLPEYSLTYVASYITSYRCHITTQLATNMQL